ncbi:MAG TPA: elongation factor P maturation arginine rhamnosyltransferase EarP [Casimicrobiaceae bacterium]
MRWDVFCRVVDNYGDAGVCWRLARQLAREHALDVTLWIDRPATLAKLEPAIDASAIDKSAVDASAIHASATMQRYRGVTLRTLDDAGAAFDPGDAVIEAFGCGLPERYLDAMEARARQPVWFNLEYLSAEPWVDGVHGLSSRHPRRPLTRYFWFPGFTAKTGGLIREAGLLELRNAAERDRLRSRGAGPETAPSATDRTAPGATELTIVLFCYPNRALPALFEHWARGDRPIRCIVPEGIAVDALAVWLGGNLPPAPHSLSRGNLTLDLRSFVSQDAFDRLLWAADVNFVRGEDSFVRAQWAAKPFVWQPYPQEERAQLAKLDAFLARYAPDTADPVQEAQRRMMRAFDAEDAERVVEAWPPFHASVATATSAARQWAAALAALPDLASGLVAFARSQL